MLTSMNSQNTRMLRTFMRTFGTKKIGCPYPNQQACTRKCRKIFRPSKCSSFLESHGVRFLNTSSSLGDPLVPQSSAKAAPAVEPFKMTEEFLGTVYQNIVEMLSSECKELGDISNYYFDGQGKAFRPVLVALVSKAVNTHLYGPNVPISEKQLGVARIAEMIHTASLVHDDVIDMSDVRRGKASVNTIWGQRKAILAGDFILSVACNLAAKMNCPEVMIALGQCMSDLVGGEFMQMKTARNEEERFKNYIDKCYHKTASLMAETCRAAAVLAEAPPDTLEHVFEYAKNLGIAFQLIDDLLDFVSNESVAGKPTANDMKLGLATAPVLYAAREFPELQERINRRFSEPGDVSFALEHVHKSDGLNQTRLLAQKHCDEAIKHIKALKQSKEQQALVALCDKVMNRMK